MDTTGSPGARAAERRFARFADGRRASDGYWPLPPDGLCLSTFVLLSPENQPSLVLVGRLDASGPWREIGALDASRIRQNAEGWMLPSCHLLYFEAPRAAAERVLAEQLGLAGVDLDGPAVFSETYRPRRHPERGAHWDLEFVFRGVAPPAWKPSHPAWHELQFVEPSRTPRTEFTRSHDEVLELAGFRLGGP